jgi:hypothetical protein
LADVNTTGAQTYRGNRVTLGSAGQTVALNSRSGTVEIITGTGLDGGIVGLERLTLVFGTDARVGDGLSGALGRAGIALDQILTRQALASSTATPTAPTPPDDLTQPVAGSPASVATNWSGEVLQHLAMQQQTDLFTSRERGQAPELLMIEVEVEIGAIEAFACEAMSVEIPFECEP